MLMALAFQYPKAGGGAQLSWMYKFIVYCLSGRELFTRTNAKCLVITRKVNIDSSILSLALLVVAFVVVRTSYAPPWWGGCDFN